jgi:hypothetical protein
VSRLIRRVAKIPHQLGLLCMGHSYSSFFPDERQEVARQRRCHPRLVSG